MTLIEEQKDLLENARVEYQAVHDSYLHYDNFSWQVGSVLVAGAFVFWGFLLDTPGNLAVLACANLIVCLLMSAWLLYANHNREIYLWKLHRIRELEVLLGMWQHRRFIASNIETPEYSIHWPAGHVLDYFIFGLVSIGGPILVVLVKPTACWPWLSVLVNLLILVIVLWRVVAVSQRTASAIREKEKQSTISSN